MRTAAVWLQDVKQAYDGEVNITWKNFPLEQVNSKEGPDWKLWEQPESYPSRGLLALRASEAARRQGDESFQRFHLALLNTRHVDRKRIDQRETLLDVARNVGLDMEKFQKDLEDPEALDRIEADYTEAREKYGVFGTPTIIPENGHAAFLKMMPAPAPEDALKVFDTVFNNVISDRPNIYEIKRPAPPPPEPPAPEK